MGRPEERGYPPPQYYYGIRGKKGASLRPDGFLDGSSFAFCRSRDFARTIRHGEKSPDQLSTRPLHAWSAWSSSETVRQPASPAIEHLPITFRNGERLKHGPTIDSPTTLPALCGTKLTLRQPWNVNLPGAQRRRSWPQCSSGRGIATGNVPRTPPSRSRSTPLTAAS